MALREFSGSHKVVYAGLSQRKINELSVEANGFDF